MDKEIILISGLMRNNENYLKNILPIFKNLEKDLEYKYTIKYLFLTNDNTDKTYDLLNNEKNEKFFVKNLELKESIKKLTRVSKLYHLREMLLNEIKKVNYDYLLMLDSDIYFNSKMLKEMISKYDNNDYDCLAANSIKENQRLFHYDTFAYRGIFNEKIKFIKNFELGILKNIIKEQLKIYFSNDILPVKSSFAGFFLTKKKNFEKKNLNYINGVQDENVCEHINFNKNFKIGLVTNITPLWVENEKKLQMKNFNFNETDLRKNTIVYFLIFLFIIIVLYLVNIFYF